MSIRNWLSFCRAHVALLRNGQKTVIQPNDADWKQKSQEYWVKEVAHQARKNSIVKAKNYNMKLATLKTLALSCAKIDARKREEVVLKSMDQHKLSIVQQTRNSVEGKATQEQEIEHDKAGEPDQLLTTLGLLTPSASSLNAFLLCELQLFVQNVLPEADPNQTLPALNIAPVVFEAAKVTSRVVVREHRRALCDFQAETERFVNQNTSEISLSLLTNASQSTKQIRLGVQRQKPAKSVPCRRADGENYESILQQFAHRRAKWIME